MPVDSPVWWDVLRLVAVANLLLWILSARMLARRSVNMPAGVYRQRRIGLILALLYVSGCAFRSYFPVADVPRICLVDSWLSSIVLGRSVATVAELALIAQCALLLYEAGKAGEVRLTVMISRLLLPIIIVAELFSWYAIISTNYAGAVIEEFLWTLGALLMIVGLIAIRSQVSHSLKPYIFSTLAFSVAYVVFMVSVDIPMYFSRMQMDLAAGREYLSLASGLADAGGRCNATAEWELWQDELKWLLPYFTVAVWFSIALTHVPWPIARKI